MNQKENVSIVSWWRYPVAILSFVSTYFLLPIIIGLLLNITNWFSPEYYKSSALELFVLSDILSATIGFNFVKV